MNLAAWIVSLGWNAELCGRLCLVLAHSLWQFALLAALAALVVRIWKTSTPEQIYALHAATLLLGLVALPVTFVLTRLPGEPLARGEAVVAPEQALAPLPILELPEELQAQQAAPPHLASKANEFLTDSQANQVSSSQNFLSWAPWLIGCYAVGVVVMLLRLMRGLWQNYRLSAQATPVNSGRLFEVLQELSRSWSLRVRPTLALTERVIVPQVVGLWRPVILLPAAALVGLRPDELEMILAHELAHVRRYDLWMNLVQRLAEAVLFFNPAVWYLSRRISTYREYCCDEATCRLARQTTDDTRLRYAEALLRAVELTQGAAQGQKLAALAASGSRPSELRMRVARLFGEPLREPVRITRTGLVAMLAGVAVLFVLPIAWQRAAETGHEDASVVETESKHRVEVLGIGTYGQEPQIWWNAQGNALEDVPFHVQGARVPGEARQLVFRIADLTKDADVTWSLSKGGGANGEVVLDGKESPPGYFSQVFAINQGSPTVNLRVGLATGEWKTATTAEGIGSQSMGLPDGKSIAFTGAFAEEDQYSKGKQATAVVVSHNFRDSNVRLVAVDKSGKNHRSTSSSTHSVGKDVLQTKYSFRDLLPDQVDHFEFQTREYEWTEIKDLPVEPGERVANSQSQKPITEPASNSQYALKVRPLLENLELAPSAYLNLWREAMAGETAKPGRQTWTDTQTQTVWIRERSAQPNDGRHGHEASEFEFTDLPPGRYYVTVATYQGNVEVPDPTPFGVSRAVLLGVGEGTENLEPLDVVMSGNRSLTVRILDSQTGEPVDGMAVRLLNSHGIPIVHGHGSGNFFERTSEVGEVHFRNLPSDEYRIDVLGRQAWVNEFVEYKPFVDSLRIQLEGPKPQTVTYNAPPHRLSDEEIAKQFPFSVHGRVTDAGGKPLADVEVRAATGHGTLLGGGRVHTDEQGKYRLHFGPGMLMMGNDAPHGVGVQTALFSAGKSGWYDRDLNRGGGYLMSDSTPEELQAQIDREGKVWGHKSLERIVFPNVPREVNFVLTPAATLRGKLTADPGNDLESQSVYLTGDELPPGCSVLKQFKTGEDGEFEITNLPVGRPWRFGMRVSGTWQEVETEPFTLERSGDHKCELTLKADKSDAQVVVKLRYQVIENETSR